MGHTGERVEVGGGFEYLVMGVGERSYRAWTVGGTL